MNNEVSTILEIIEDNKQNLKDMDYKNILETLSKLNNASSKKYYKLKFQLIEVIESDDEFRPYIKFIDMVFHMEESLSLTIRQILNEDKMIMNIHTMYSVADYTEAGKIDAQIINEYMEGMRRERDIIKHEEDYTLKDKFHRLCISYI